MPFIFSWLRHQCRLFFIALQFFTRLPIPRWVGFEADWLHHAARYFPLVGAVVAAIASAVYALAACWWPISVAVLLSTIAGIYATGAFHEDGFADMCDGFGGGLTRERVLEIMKDSRIGAYGTAGMLSMLALKCVALAALPPGAAIGALFLAHPLSRLAATSLIWRLDYVRANGKAKPIAQEMTNAEFAIATVCAALPVLVILLVAPQCWPAIVGGLLAMAVATVWMARKCLQRLGGYTGDCLGAIQQVTEVALYLSLLAASRHGSWL